MVIIPFCATELFQIDYLTTLSNQAVDFPAVYHKKLDDGWRQEAEALRDALQAQNLNMHLIGRTERKPKSGWIKDYIDERLPVAGKEMIYRQVRNSFTIERGDEYSDAGMGAGRNQRLKRRFTGLYCGNGNFH